MRIDLTSCGFLPGHKNFVLLGEAGCGKSELALNLALALRKLGQVCLFDLDMTKPLFRSRDQAEGLEKAGVRVCFEEQFMDAPTAAGGVSRSLRQPELYTVLDVGGDYIGARAVGGYAAWLNRPDTVPLYVINPYRPWSATLEHIDRVLGETLGVSHLQLDRLELVANPNLGPETTVEDVIAGLERLREMVEPYKPVRFLCVREELAERAAERTALPVFPLGLRMGYPWEENGPTEKDDQQTV